MAKCQKWKRLIAFVLAWVVAFGMAASPAVTMNVYAATPAEIGQSSSSVTATIEKVSGDGAYHEYALKVDNKLNESIGDWIVEVSISGISKVENWSSWAKIKSSFTSDSLYLAPYDGSQAVISANGSYGSTSIAEYKFGYSGSNDIDSSKVTVYYKTGSSYTGAFDSVMGSSSSGGSSSGGSSSTDMNLDVEYNYAKALQYSLYFYDANMCGELEDSCSLNWRKNCHLYDKNVTYNGKTVDVSGGFHDAGDHDKFGLPQGYSASILGMGYYEYKDAYVKTGQQAHFKKILDYFCDYFVRCTVCDDNGDAIAFCYQVGNGDSHSYWMSAEDETIDRPAYFADSSTPATDQVSEAAAALAIHYMNFGNSEYLDCAKKLFAMAQKNGKAAQSSNGGGFYSSTAWQDDYCLAAAWLYKATNDNNYKSEFEKYKSELNNYCWASWDSVDAYATAYGTGSMDALEMNATSMKNGGQNGDNGMTWISEWGTNRYNSNVQLEGLIYDKYMNSDSFTSWAQAQMKIILGNNSTKQNYIVGYNANSPKYPHHRTASGYSGFPQDGNEYTEQKYSLIGALVGGPESTTVYHDSSADYYCNEVALDYNAAFTGALAALYLKNQNDGQQHIVKNGDSDAPSVIKTYYGDGSGEVTVTTTQAPTTTQAVTTTQAPTTTQAVTTTQAPTTTQAVITTQAPTTTQAVTTTQAPTTTQLVTTTQAPTTTQLVTTTQATTTEFVTTMQAPTTAGVPEQPTTENAGTTTELVTTTAGVPEQPTTENAGTTTELVTTTAGVPEQPTTENADTTTELVTTTVGVPEQPTTENMDTTTELVTTTASVPEQPTTENVDTTTELVTTTAGVPEQPTTVNPDITSENPSVTTQGVSDQPISTQAPVTTTEVPVIGVDKVELNCSSITMKLADSEQLTAFVVPANATNQEMSWNTSNPNVVVVNRNGGITAVGVGEAVITVVVDGKMAECKVYVEDSTGPEVEASDIVLNTNSLELNKGESQALIATIYPEAAATKTINWSSENPTIARVDDNGMVFAAGGGETVIYAQIGNVKAQCSVKVQVPVSSVTLETDALRLVAGKTGQLTANVLPADATDAVCSWSSSDETVATIDANGIITAYKSGTAIIRATVGSLYAECNITVVDAVRGIYLDKENVSLTKGKSISLNATVEGEDETVQTVVWQTQNPDVVFVDDAGNVTALASGTATVTAQTKDGKYQAVCNVTVTNPLQSIEMEVSTVSVKVAGSVLLKANVTPQDADGADNIEWTSNDESIAVVDSQGNVTGLKAGSTIVFAKIGEAQAYCIVNVEKEQVLLSNPYIINISELAMNASYADGLYVRDAITGELKQTAAYNSVAKQLELMADGKEYTIVGEYAGLNIIAGENVTVNLSGVVCNNIVAGNIVVNGSLTAGILNAQSSVTIKNGMVSVDKIIAKNVMINGGSVKVANAITASDAVLVSGADTLLQAHGADQNAAIYAENLINITDSKVIVSVSADKNDAVAIAVSNKDTSRIVLTNANVERADGMADSQLYSKEVVGNNAGSQSTTQSSPNTTQSNNNTTNDYNQSVTTQSSGSNQPATTQGPASTTGANSQNTTSANAATTQSNNSTANGSQVSAITGIKVKARIKNAGNVVINDVYKLAKNTSMRLLVSYEPSGAYEAMTFTSSNSEIASVSANGVVTTGNKAGVAQITVQSVSGVTKNFYVQVMSGKVTSIKIKASNKTIKAKKKLKLKVAIKKKNIVSNKIVWKSSNTSVAKVSSGGVVTARKKGKVKITAVVADGTGKKATITLKVK